MAGRRMRMIGAASALALVVGAGCSDDDEDDAVDTEEEATTTTAAAEDEGDEPAGDVIEVTARDYEFEGVPDTVAAGTSFSLTTEADGEPHEFTLIKLPDGETRSVDELIELPQEEVEALIGPGFQFVLIAMPGTTDTPGAVEGTPTVTEPGNYVYVCAFPQGTTVEDVQNATGPLEGDTPPHFVLGMRGEFTVE